MLTPNLHMGSDSYEIKENNVAQSGYDLYGYRQGSNSLQECEKEERELTQQRLRIVNEKEKIIQQLK
jgi:hypothetical protein